MAIEITMPQLSDTMDQGTILTWLKKEGEQVERGDALAEVATDKADLEIESFHEGTLLKIQSPEGTTVKVGEVIAIIGEAGEVGAGTTAPTAPQQTAESPATPQPAAPQPAAPQQAVSPQAVSPQAVSPQAVAAQPNAQPAAQPTGGEERVRISPLAKNLAQSYGVDFREINGSGEGGRITKRDIERHLGRELDEEEIERAVRPEAGGALRGPGAVSAGISGQPSRGQAAEEVAKAGAARAVEPAAGSPAAGSPAAAKPAAPQPAAPQPAQSGVRAGSEPLTRMRQTIADRMAQSASTIPHFYVAAKLEVDRLVSMRESLKTLPQYEGVTFNHLMLKACGLALRAVPRINASYRDGSLIQPQDINIGIITALEDGLLIPVVKQADAKPLADIVAEARALVQRARSGRPKSEDLLGGTFCISNIGRYEVESFTAIINPGQGAILAVSSIQEEPLVRGGAVVPGQVMRVTLSVDHRIIDGVVAGEFLTELKRLIEDPVLLLA